MIARNKVEPATIAIPPQDVSFHPHSFADDAGRLFKWNGRLWRGINAEQAPFFDGLLRDGTIESLVKRGLLIDTAPSNVNLNGYATVLSHRAIPFISYPNEWCAAMLKDAALVILDLAIELTQRRLTLKDSHPWNVLFDWSQPVYVDLTSIAPQEDLCNWAAYDEFCRFCYYPLLMISNGHHRIARALLPEYQGVLRSEVENVIQGNRLSWKAQRLLRRCFNSMRPKFSNRSSQSALTFLEQTRKQLEAVRLPSFENQHRSRRNESMLQAVDNDRASQPLTVRKILNQLRPSTVLDLSRGPIWTTLVPALMGHNVVSVDSDEARISALYKTAREKNLPILPLIVDFIKPTPSVGYSNHYSISAVERLKCDLVLALGLVNRIASENGLTFDLIAEGLASFAKRWLVVEFEDRKNKNGIPPDYGRTPGGIQSFINALGARFKNVNIITQSTSGGTMLLCEKGSDE